MPKVTNYDVLTFFFCVLAGVALSVFADVLRALRKYGKLGDVAVFLTDMLFCIITAVITFLMQFIYSNGSIRFYILFGELCGFVAARIAVSPLNNKLFGWIYHIIYAIIRPIKTVLSSIFRFFNEFCKKICKKFSFFTKNILKSIGCLVYNINNSVHRRKADKTHKSISKAERSSGKKKKKR